MESDKDIPWELLRKVCDEEHGWTWNRAVSLFFEWSLQGSSWYS